MPRKPHRSTRAYQEQQTTKKKVSPKIQFLLGWNGHPNMDLPINEDLTPVEVWKIIQDYIKRNNLLKDSKYQFIYPDEKFAECFEVNKLLPLGIQQVSHLFYWKHNQFTIE